MSKKKRKRKEKRSTASAARRRSEQHQTGFEITSLSLPEGATLFSVKSDKAVRLDILPYVVGKGNPWADEGELHYERTYFVHRGIGAENNSYVCLSKTLGKKCPICEFRAKLAKDPDADEQLIKDLGPKERQLFNIIDTQNRDKGVQIWDISFHLFGKALDARIRNADDDDEYENFAELENGSTLKLGIEEGHYGRISFFGVETIDFKNRKEDYDEDTLDEVYCLDEIIKITPYDELKKILLQTEDDEDDEDDEEEKPKSKKSKSKKKKKQQDEEDDEDDDDEDDDDEDDDEDEDEDDEDDFEDDEDDFEDDDDEDDDEDEDEDDEDDEDEDDDDEPPKKSKKKKTTKKKSKKKKTTKKKSSKKGVRGKERSGRTRTK